MTWDAWLACAGLIFGPIAVVELRYRYQMREIRHGRWRKYQRF